MVSDSLCFVTVRCRSISTISHIKEMIWKSLNEVHVSTLEKLIVNQRPSVVCSVTTIVGIAFVRKKLILFHPKQWPRRNWISEFNRSHYEFLRPLFPKIWLSKSASTYCHYNDVIMAAMASQITSLTFVYSTVYSGTDEKKTQMASNMENVSVWWRHHGGKNGYGQWS